MTQFAPLMHNSCWDAYGKITKINTKIKAKDQINTFERNHQYN